MFFLARWKRNDCGIAVLASLLVCASPAAADDRVELPDGFRLVKAADDELATNIFCMIALPDGDVLVSGPGYIRRLSDTNDDGAFDVATEIAGAPATGAQGMAVDGEDLLCVGDGGIWRLSGAMRAAGTSEAVQRKPVRLFEISTGGEHHAHSIQKGPDGWWYHIAGNNAEFDSANFTGPIGKHRAGVIMRFSPDFSQHQLMAHGFRNAYDFAFNSTAQLFTFDSDGERDLGLPWYRPTRVFEIVPGDDAGWVSKSWKRPSYYFDMPRLVGDAGRASPTGVACYDGLQFPEEYDDAIFCGDWTFGRILVCKRGWESGKYQPPVDFLKAKGSFGFAVTDIAVANDGSLLISVGGRGTEGGVWRVDATSKRSKDDESLGPHFWGNRVAFRQENRAVDRIEAAFTQLNQQDAVMRTDGLASLLNDSQQLDFNQFGDRLSVVLETVLKDDDPKVLGASFRLIQALSRQKDWRDNWTDPPKRKDYGYHVFMLAAIASWESGAERSLLFTWVFDAPEHLKGGCDPFPKNVRYRLAQILLGGVGGVDGFFASVTAKNPIRWSELQGKNGHSLLAKEKQSPPWSPRDKPNELARLAAMQRMPNEPPQPLFVRVKGAEMNMSASECEYKSMSGLFDRSRVTNDLHWLACVLRLKRSEDIEFIEILANGLLDIQKNARLENLRLDSHWQPMIREMAARAFVLYPELSDRYLKSPQFGAAEHDHLFDCFSDDDLPRLQSRVSAWVEKNPDAATTEHVRVLAKSPSPKVINALRSLVGRNSIKHSVTLALAKHGDAGDRDVFVNGLRSLDPKVKKESAIALRKHRVRLSNSEAAEVLLAAMRLGSENQDVSIRDQLILLLRSHAGQNFGYQVKQPAMNQHQALQRWRAFLIQRDPGLAETLIDAESSVRQVARLEKLDWSAGNSARGKVVYETLQCAGCHGSNRAFGPRLEGVTMRLRRTDLLTAIIDPDAQVSDRYRATMFETVDGQFHLGTIIYENVDGVTLRDSSGRTVRLNQDQIESRKRSKKSVMPSGLLDQATDEDVADLWAYLKEL